MVTGEEARNKAMAQVEENADEEWKSQALRAIATIASGKDELTTDDVWARLPYPRERRALGPIMATAVRRGFIRPTGEYRNSVRPECHARPIAVYESLVWWVR